MLTEWRSGGLEYSLAIGRNLVALDPGPDGITGTFDDGRPLRLLPLVMMWPVIYMLGMAIARNRRAYQS
jgi:hypothetical protein